MNLGLALNNFAELRNALPLIRDLGTTHVKWGWDIGTGDPATLAADLEQVRAWGLTPIIDLRTDRNAVREMVRGAAGTAGGNPYAEVYEHYAAAFAATVRTCADVCRDWEWWGEPYCPHVTGGAFTTWDYAQSLRIVHEAAHRAVPDCRVWVGGFGVNLGIGQASGMAFLRDLVYSRCPRCGVQYEPHFEECTGCRVPLRAGAGQAFDVANLHPYAHSRNPAAVEEYHDKQLDTMRLLLDGPWCAGQPFASNEWGLPTVPRSHTPSFLHSWVLEGGVEAVCEPDAPAWFDLMLAIFARHDFETVCICTLTDHPAYTHWSHYCGLRCAQALDGDGPDAPRWKVQADTIRRWATGERDHAPLTAIGVAD